nr:cold shock domain-containing protein [Oscillatoria sp. FACHB-1406]
MVRWKEDRGFGFIKPDKSDREVFLHISELRSASRRPKVGDIIFYEQVSEPNGKIRAVKASIKGVPSRSSTATRKPKQQNVIKIILGVGILSAIVVAAIRFSPEPPPSPSISSSPVPSVERSECNIKGNISIQTGNKIYHLPGMEDYESTNIDVTKGERWFCTESEALANGWRKAPS